VSDNRLDDACAVACRAGLLPLDEATLPPVFLSEYVPEAARFADAEAPLKQGHFSERPRLGLLPMSYAGLTMDDVVRVPGASNYYTVPLPAACAALIRVAMKQRHLLHLRADYISDIAGLIGYNLFDMSYEGDYLDIPGNEVPLSSAELAEIDEAVRQIRSWRFRPSEQWMQDLLVRVVTMKADYEEIYNRPM
jgi:hypothetical protein